MVADLAHRPVTDPCAGHRSLVPKLWFMPAKYDIKILKTKLTVCGLSDKIYSLVLFQMNMEA
jgi:hypothetical protein